jgi:uncharacterized protein DUF6916
MQLTDLHLSRRRMVVALGGAAVGVGALLAAPLRSLITTKARELANAVPLLRRTVNLATAGYDDWLAQVGSTFAGGVYSLRLAGVAPLNSAGARPAGLRARAFALNFDLAGGRTMAGDLIYTISHPQYGPLQIFLSATGPQTPARMLAVFN